MSKEAVFHPNYQLHREPAKVRDIVFRHEGVYFIAKLPFFGMSETMKAALKWAESQRTSPVLKITHDKPGKSDKGGFFPYQDPHLHFHPYAMSIATIDCLGESKPRKVKVYFGNSEIHVREDKIHTEPKKDIYIEEIKEDVAQVA